ncbi:MAG: ABC transporter ATP-binding protein [Candidatus Riflebacteria bacterium]|nr:ABC transporter ATP-binding protein [Candidatus Riflebacteria bacterium]
MRHPEHEVKHARIYYLKWIISRYQGRWFLIFVLLILTILSTVVSVLFPLIFKYIIDTMTENLKLFNAGKIDLAVAYAVRNKLLLLFLGLGIGSWFTGLYPFLRGRMNLIFERIFREAYFAEILEKGHRFFLKFRTGDMVTRLTSDVQNYPPGLSWLCCSGLFRAFNSSCIIFFCLFSMFWLNVKLALLAIIPLPFMVLFFMKLEPIVTKRFKKLQEGISDFNDFLESGYSGIKILKSFNAEESQIGIFSRLMDRRINLEIDVAMVEGIFTIFYQFLSYLGQIVVLLFGGIMVVKGQLSIGEYYAFFSYLGMIVFPLIDIPMMFVTLAQSFISIDRLEEMADYDKDWRDEKTGSRPVTHFEKLEFKGVSFRFSEPSSSTETEKIESTAASVDGKSTPFGLSELNFSVQSGEKLAIVGKIGSGKTTLLNLVAGILAPEKGVISVNGIPSEELDKHSLREKIGYIQQEPVVFSETIAANIDFWRNRPLGEVEECAKLAQFEEEICSFPNGYQEKVGQKGVTLSGGQRQRLSIARALAGKPQLLLMDDVTSSLDAENELQLWQDLNQSFPNLTCVIVTHRLSSAQNADRIMVLSDGRIDAIGTHQELIQNNHIYQQLTNP